MVILPAKLSLDDELRRLGVKLLSGLVVWQQILLYLSSDGCTVNTVVAGCVLISRMLCRWYQ